MQSTDAVEVAPELEDVDPEEDDPEDVDPEELELEELELEEPELEELELEEPELEDVDPVVVDPDGESSPQAVSAAASAPLRSAAPSRVDRDAAT